MTPSGPRLLSAVERVRAMDDQAATVTLGTGERQCHGGSASRTYALAWRTCDAHASVAALQVRDVGKPLAARRLDAIIDR